jgi:hypothetical protein
MIRSWWRHYIQEPFEHTRSELPWFDPIFSGIVVAFIVNILTTWLTELAGPAVAWPVTLLLIGLTVAFVRFYQQRRRQLPTPIDLPRPRKYRGLIFMFSRPETLRAALTYHQPKLEHCWLLITPEMRTRALDGIPPLDEVRFSLCHLENLYDTAACYTTVQRIFEQEARQYGIAPDQIIADITGGTKPMTVGMLLACQAGGYALEHVPTQFDAVGRPTDPLPPIEIRLRNPEN